MENRDEIVNDGRNAFLKRKLSGEVGFEVKMLTQNEPARFLKIGIRREREETYLEYNITGLTALASCDGEFVLECLFGLLSAIANLSEICGEYLLSADKIDLNPECIFIRRETGQFYFCYDPEKETTARETLLSLAEFLMKTATPVEEEDVLLVYGLYRKMREPNVTLKTPLAYWRETHFRGEPGREPGVYTQPRERNTETENPFDKGIYEKIGIDSGELYSSFDAWKRTHRKNDIATTKPEDTYIESQVVEPMEELPKKKKGGGFKRFFQGKFLEIAIGLVALAVSAWFLFA